MKKRSFISDMNFLKNSWKTQEEVNSTIKQYREKIIKLKKERSKRSTLESTKTELTNDIKYYSHMLYLINLEYYEIIGNLK